jgi:hypothetical protein
MAMYPVGTASVCWQDNSGLHLRVYWTDGNNIHERLADSNGWQDGTLNVPGSDVSAITWQDSAGAHIRVYATQADQITEWCQDPGSTAWQKGQFTV